MRTLRYSVAAPLIAVVGVGITALSGGALSAQGQSNAYYAGKTIQMIVPFAQGGATDVTARFLEPFLEKHIPGNPDVEIVNRGGGGSILGANWFAANAEPDGTMMLFTTSSTANPYVLEQPAVEYDLGSMEVAFSFPFGAVAYVSPSTGITKPEDLRTTDTPLIYGGIAAAASDLPGLLSFEVLGLDVKSVLGFEGRGPVRLAFDRGETNFDYQFTPVYLTQVAPQVESGNAVPLWTGGAVGEDGRVTERDPVLPDLPSVYEVYKLLNGGEEPSGEAWDAYQAIAALTYSYGLTGYLPPETPAEVIEIFENAVVAINADPEFKEASEEVAGGYSLIPPSEAEAPLKAALKPSKEVKAYLRELLSTKYGVTF